MKVRFRIGICLLLFLLPLLLLAMENGDTGEGKKVFERCAICHGANGEGNEAMAKAYGVEIPPLYSEKVQSQEDASLRKVIVEGKGKMTPVKLTDQQVTDLIAYLRSLKK